MTPRPHCISVGRRKPMARHRSDISVLGASSRVTGNVRGAGGLRVEGTVKGDVAVDGPVEVVPDAIITGNVEGESLDLEGTLEGDASTSGPIRIGARATATGSFRGAQVTIEPGARVALQLDQDFELDLGPTRRGR